MATIMDLKRKAEYEDGSPLKRGRVTAPPLALVKYSGDDFDEVSWQPLPPFILSPFEKSQSPLDNMVVTNFNQYDRNVREAFAFFRNHDNVLGFREEIRSVCDGERIAWADPSGPSIFDPGEGLLLNNADGTNGVIRFRRVTRTGQDNKKLSTWFLYVQAGLDIKINNQVVDPSIDTILGPLPSFFVFQYGPRVVFLYTARVAVDYLPLPSIRTSGGKPESSPGSTSASKRRLLQLRLQSAFADAVARREGRLGLLREEGLEAGADGRRLEQEELAKKAAKEAKQRLQEEIAKQEAEEAQRRLEEAKRKAKEEKERAAAAAEEERRAKAKLQAEILPTDVSPCEYFRWRLKEWQILHQRAGTKLEHGIKKVKDHEVAEWLTDDQIWRAVSCVTTAIELENGYSFCQLSNVSSQQCRGMTLLPNMDFLGHRREMYMPWNLGNSHWILVRARLAPTGPQVTYYDSYEGLGVSRGILREAGYLRAVRNTLWLGGTIEDQSTVNTIQYVPSSQQGNGFGCGYFTVLNAWCFALGLEPTFKTTSVFTRTKSLIVMFNLAMEGLMDSSTIHAFLICTGFASAGSTVSPNRHFSHTVPFYREDDLSAYFHERMRIASWPGVPRISPQIMRSIITHSGVFVAEDVEDKMRLLEAYYQWLEFNGMPRDAATSPLSPVSPATVRLALEEAKNSDLTSVPLPSDFSDLRQIFDVYRALLRSNGILSEARQIREIHKATAATEAETEGIEEVPRSPLYGSELQTALGRLEMLPQEGYLEDETVEVIRGRTRVFQPPPPPPPPPPPETPPSVGGKPKKKGGGFFRLVVGRRKK